MGSPNGAIAASVVSVGVATIGVVPKPNRAIEDSCDCVAVDGVELGITDGYVDRNGCKPPMGEGGIDK